MDFYADTFSFSRVALKSGVALVYLLAFLSALRQFLPLLGEKGLLPVPNFLRGRTFKKCPTIFHLGYTDRRFLALCWTGVALSFLCLVGVVDRGPVWFSIISWLVLWFLYLSLVNVGQRFYGFGWETMLLEAGFFVSFLGPLHLHCPAIPILCLRWMLFRVEVGAGLIKMRGDKCWKDLTCLIYHYETQPLPNPLSWHFHHLPRWFHRVSVAGSHVIQLVVPFGLFLPQPVAGWGAAIMIAHQVWLIVCGNYSWLNWLTIVLCFSGLGDTFVGRGPEELASNVLFSIVIAFLGLFTLYLSRDPVMNLVAKRQRMNSSYNPFRLVNSYGAFGSITKVRYEVVLEGTSDQFPLEESWQEYHFVAKPGRVDKLAPQIAPYHLRLDWQMWFLPFNAQVVGNRVRLFRKDYWFERFIERLLKGDKDILKLLAYNPFPDQPPVYIRARYYRYRYTTPQERRETGAWWHRELLGDFRPPLHLTGA